jgi:hypothetical protein
MDWMGVAGVDAMVHSVGLPKSITLCCANMLEFQLLALPVLMLAWQLLAVSRA